MGRGVLDTRLTVRCESGSVNVIARSPCDEAIHSFFTRWVWIVAMVRKAKVKHRAFVTEGLDGAPCIHRPF
jgi:hypothetical protein